MRQVTRHDGDGWWLEIRRQFTKSRTINQPDPQWSYTDPAGHVHTYDEDLEVPTGKEVWEEHWCVLCHDIHQRYKFVCRKCGALVHPGTKRDREVEHMAGPASIRGEVTDEVPCFERLAQTQDTGEAVDVTLGPYTVRSAYAVSLVTTTRVGAKASNSRLGFQADGVDAF